MTRKMLCTALAAVAVISVTAAAQTGLPELRVTTRNNAEPTSKTDNGCSSNNWGWGGGFGGVTAFDYIEISTLSLTVQGTTLYDITRNNERDSIRLRGNSTASADKKPYRIKFNDKVSVFGKERAKSWVLLANWYDPTFALNSIGFRLGDKLGLDHTPTSNFVNLWINNNYKGIYQLTEQVQVNPGRVDIDPEKGWLVEFDFHDPASDECRSYYTSSRYSLPTFIKSPEDLADSTGYRFVKQDINRLVDSMYSNRFPGNGYRDLIDLESFAKYVLIQQVIDNHDFNSKSQSGGLLGSNFAYKDAHHKRIYAGPLWDMDLSAGVTTNGFPAHYNTTTEALRPKHAFYQRLWEDPAFLAKFKKAWDTHKADFDAIPAFIDSIANVLRSSAQANFRLHTCSGGGFMSYCPTIPTSEQAYITEVGKLKTWWTSRMQNVQQQINQLNIDLNLDVQQAPEDATTSILGGGPKFVNGSSLAAVKNGINLSVVDKADVRVYGLDGRTVRKVNVSRGSHTLRFGDLPKGMYVVRIAMDGDKRTLRVPVR